MTIRGWRGRIGYVRPVYHATDYDFWVNTRPEGISIASVVLGYQGTSVAEFRTGLDRSAELAAELAQTSCHVIVTIGTPPFLIAGPQEELAWAAALGRELAVPIVSGMWPHAVALRAIGASRPLIASYYQGSLLNSLTDYLRAAGVDGVAHPGFSPRIISPGEDEEDGGQTGGHLTLNDVGADEVYDFCKHAFLSSTERPDAIYINGSGWDAEPAVRVLEHDLGVPVVWAQHAVSWYTYRLLHVNNSRPVSQLYDTWPELPAAEHARFDQVRFSR